LVSATLWYHFRRLKRCLQWSAAPFSALNRGRLGGQREVSHIAAGGAAFIRREIPVGGAALATAIWLTSSATTTQMAAKVVYSLVKTASMLHRSSGRYRISNDVNLRDVLQWRG
jgi:hypothetical protein